MSVSGTSVPVEDSFSSQQHPQRVSKAQKRRDKKKQREAERLEEIERQEEANKTGQRAVETERIQAILASRY